MSWLEFDERWRGDDSSGDADIVRLMHHDPRWHQEFQQTRSSVLMCCEGRVTDVQHIGGTALDGLIARPVIDVVAVVEAGDDWQDAQACIEGLNFKTVRTPQWVVASGRGPTTLEKPRHGETTHRVFLVLPQSPMLRHAIAIRDHFGANREAAIAFEEWKVQAWRETQGDPDAYEHAKATYFAALLERLR